ncbi:QueT transporter family protein [Megasphaera paucivorans]
MYNFISDTKRMTISAMVITVYVVLLYMTQSISFGAYQIRIATALYALAYIYPFLVIPLGIANLLSNFFFGGLGIIDMLGGCAVGIITTWIITQINFRNLNIWFVALPIWVVPSLCVSIWLSYLLQIPYSVLAGSLMVGQLPPAIVGVLMVHALQRVYMPGRQSL